MRYLYFTTLWLFGVILTTNVLAQQTRFQKNDAADFIGLRYEWLDHQEQTRELTFSLSKEITQNQYRNQTDYKPEIAQRYVYVELMRQVQQINPMEARVKLVHRGERIEVSVTSRSRDMISKWQNLMAEKQESAFDQYLDDNHYARFTNHAGQEGVLPDHIRYVRESRDIVLPVAQAIYDELQEGSDTRDYINLLLSWLQSIPYDTLENRIGTSGSGFFSPVEVLVNNKGDCDSKATLAAALMRALLPNLSMAIVYLPNHALLAVNLGYRNDEQWLDIRGAPHVLIEPTGPAKMTIGKTSDETARHLANGSYTYVLVP
ncbi:hypothetical protein [Aliiglaciecola sp. M165]|uniref:hypothetical protein n=1 Tax=Aliiglaciecola sp. M165 TaxID=2593649 RepID=UPI00117FBF85|nr:hypothetical protein [Aliiglaciecola sp. M165]TRY32924.1 hypothetical protein FM019_02740 [Aliiglaciecola sp. M165]